MNTTQQPFIITATGLAFPLLTPEAHHVRLRDISRHLAKLNRFVGATRECYSVAQHSLHVAEWLAAGRAPPLLQLYGLLHDAHEAYTGDITRPMKLALKGRQDRMGLGYRCPLADIEDAIQNAVHTAFGLAPLLDDTAAQAIKTADGTLLATEVRDLMPESDWKPHGSPAPFRVSPKPWDVIEERFLRKFHQLVGITGVTPLAGALD